MNPEEASVGAVNVASTHVEPQQLTILGTTIPGVTFAVGTTAANGLQVTRVDVQHDLPLPYRAKGERVVSELPSLLDELTRRPLTAGESTLWGDYSTGTVNAVYNDHTTALPAWRDDILTLKLTQDPDWARWHKISGTWFDQSDFGDILEELLHTVIEPDQADLLEIVDSIRATSSGTFESRIDRSQGGQQLTYSQEVKATAGGRSTVKLEVPKTVKLKLRPWEGHIETYEIEAWFRLRVDGGHLRLAIKLKPTQQTIRQAWADMSAKVVAQTGIPVLAFRGAR